MIFLFFFCGQRRRFMSLVLPHKLPYKFGYKNGTENSKICFLRKKFLINLVPRRLFSDNYRTKCAYYSFFKPFFGRLKKYP